MFLHSNGTIQGTVLAVESPCACELLHERMSATSTGVMAHECRSALVGNIGVGGLHLVGNMGAGRSRVP